MTGETDESATGPEPMSWEAFTLRLAEGLRRMAVESFLILSQPDDDAGSRGYLQFAHWDKGSGEPTGLRVEAAGSRNLPATRRLTPVQEERLGALGWKPPAPEDACQNHVREWDMPPPDEVAAVVVQTLREVYGVVEPAELRFRYAALGRAHVEDLGLGLEAEPRPQRPGSKPGIRQAGSPLAPVVEEGLRRWLGVGRLARDGDGDYPIPVGSALVFVRVVEGRLPMVAIFSSILSDVEEGPGLFAALNDINTRIRFARAFWAARTIVVAIDLPAIDITADQIAFACVQLGGLADYLDDALHGRFGGGFAFVGRSTPIN